MKKIFVTIFDRTKNFHLVKDVGQIPYHISKEHEYISKILTCKNENIYTYLNDEVKGLQLEFINNLKILKINFAVIFYLIKNAKKIDILHQFHIRNYTLLYAMIYKIFNRKGINYIKADANEKDLLQRGSIIKKKYYKIIDKYVDFISFETNEIVKLVQEEKVFLKTKFFKISNGIDEEYLKKLDLNNIDCSKKENIIIYVARIGSYQKNTELFLNAIEKVQLQDWKVYLIGEVDDNFKPFIKTYFDRNKNLVDKVIFKGNITSREKIYKYYKRSKIFCMTSRYEGFPLVYPEAIYFGNFILTTDVSGSKDITDNQKYGKIVSDLSAENYSLILNELISSSTLNSNLCNEIRNFAGRNFTWQSIVAKLDKKLKEKI